MSVDFNGSTILITGGTGSFGKQFAQTVLDNYDVHKLIIFSRDEMKQFDMQHEPRFKKHEKKLRFFLGDVRDADRLERAFNEVDYVVHAAALKHVTSSEYNPFECIRTNVHGAENVVTAAIRARVKKVIALSTDKAVNPANLYGASKLASDKIFVAAQNLVGKAGEPVFAVVRYGNVVGSRGSVVPLFKRMIEEGAKTLPVTDPNMTRFWITLQQGVDFVRECFGLMKGGEIFVPKIPSMNIMDMVEVMAPGLKAEIVGIRPGEKIHEALITESDVRSTVELPDMFVVQQDLWPIRHTYHENQKDVSMEFRYTSDNNTEWLKPEDMKKILDSLEP